MRSSLTRVSVLALIASAAVSWAQSTTQPSNISVWTTVTERFANASVNADTNAARDLASPTVTVVRGMREPADLNAVVARAGGGSILATHAYVYPPMVMAADLAADFKSSPSVTEDTKQLMVPTDDEAMKRANATAVQWIGQSLGATNGTPVSVVVLMPAMTDPAAPPPIPVLLLMKGEADSSGAVHVTKIVFGTPQQLME